MLSQNSLLLDQVLRNTSPVDIIKYLSKYLEDQSGYSKTGSEKFMLGKCGAILRQSAIILDKTVQNMREHHPKNRVWEMQNKCKHLKAS